MGDDQRADIIPQEELRRAEQRPHAIGPLRVAARRAADALDARDTEIARLRAAVQHHHDTVWGEHGPVQHDADADLYEAVGVRLGNGGTND
jgi:hypothetical protein